MRYNPNILLGGMSKTMRNLSQVCDQEPPRHKLSEAIITTCMNLEIMHVMYICFICVAWFSNYGSPSVTYFYEL
jgi:hypothetical protein